MAAIDDFLNRSRENTPIQRIGIGGFTALARVSEGFSLTSQAPTSYLEDGSFANDHIILEPLTITIEGVVADVYIEKPQESIVQSTKREIGNITRYLPLKTQSQIQRTNELINDINDKIKQASQAVEDGKQLLDFLGNKDEDGSAGHRETFIGAMEALHYGKQVVPIDMPYRRYESMRITAVSVVRDNQNEALRFQLAAQKVRIADVIYVETKKLFKKPATGTGGKTESEVSKGVQQGKSTSRSALDFIIF